MNFRSQLEATVIGNGAEFRKQLERRSVTHLIARAAEGEKYKFAALWNIKIVSLKWLEDSLKRGMVLEESLYDPQLPAEQQGIGAWNRVATPTKRNRQQGAGAQRQRKLRRVASAKLGGQNEGLWSEIVGDNASTTSQHTDVDNGREAVDARSTVDPRVTIQEEKSFASETTLSARPGILDREELIQRGQVPERSPKGMWFNCVFFINGFSTHQVSNLDIHRRH